MQWLRIAVVDISTLVATCRALRASHQADARNRPLAHAARAHREIRRATAAYLRTLAGNKRSGVDPALLNRCRVAAEREMPTAIKAQPELLRLMTQEPGALAGMAASRQDLWRLAHIAVYLGLGLAELRAGTRLAEASAAGHLGRKLRRRLRRAMVAYARAGDRILPDARSQLAAAREAAWASLGARGLASAERLAELEARCGADGDFIRRGVATAMRDLALDWVPDE